MRQTIRRRVAITAAEGARLASIAAGHSGTALPGVIAELVDPSILADLARDLDPVVLVVGTNGKTTTSRLIVRILARTGSSPVANASGANLRQGILAALLHARRRGTGEHGRPRAAVFEVDELAFATVAADVQPDVVVMTNLFRDQLDRYGETERIVAEWRGVLDRLPSSARLVLCSDDPRLEELAAAAGRRTLRFGHTPPEDDGPATATTDRTLPSADPVTCHVCRTPLTFTWRTIGHLGAYHCPAGHVRRHAPDIAARAVAAEPGVADGGSIVRFEGLPGDSEASVGLDGAAAAYDCAAAVAVAIAVGMDSAEAVHALDGASPAFGRAERADLEGRHLILTLVKNPASLVEGARAAIRRHPDGILLALNDLGADGRDVSWIWDVDLDELGQFPVVGLSGTRADDLAVRLKYGASPGAPLARGDVDPDPERALTATARRIRPDGTLVVLATYTALMAIRHSLQRRGLVAPIPR